MFITRLFQYLRGYLVITVTGRYPERFFNVCAGRNILIWDVFPCSQTVFRCSISNRGFKMLPKIAKKTDVKIKIVKKCGFSTLLKRMKKRKIFVLGVGFFLLLLICLNLFVWKIEIMGCERVSARQVREVLEECGLKVGVFRPYLDEKKLQNRVLIQMPELAWIWADKSGSKVTVQVKERVPRPELFDKHDFCNIVAEKDGVIESMIVRGGTPVISLGDTVRQGDILVSGLILSEKGVEPRKVQSDAEIYARVWYEKTKAYSLWCPKISETGNVQHKTTLHLFGWNLNLFFKPETQFSTYIETIKEREMSFFGRYLGIGMTERIYRETIVTEEKMTAESMAEKGNLELCAMIDEETASNSQKKENRMSYQVLDEDTIEVTVVVEYLEDIAKKVHIE